METFTLTGMIELYWRIDGHIEELLAWIGQNLPQDAANEMRPRWKTYLKSVPEPERQILTLGGALDLLATAKPLMPHNDGSLPERFHLASRSGS